MLKKCRSGCYCSVSWIEEETIGHYQLPSHPSYSTSLFFSTVPWLSTVPNIPQARDLWFYSSQRINPQSFVMMKKRQQSRCEEWVRESWSLLLLKGTVSQSTIFALFLLSFPEVPGTINSQLRNANRVVLQLSISFERYKFVTVDSFPNIVTLVYLWLLFIWSHPFILI